jgi:hypothetical protein
MFSPTRHLQCLQVLGKFNPEHVDDSIKLAESLDLERAKQRDGCWYIKLIICICANLDAIVFILKKGNQTRCTHPDDVKRYPKSPNHTNSRIYLNQAFNYESPSP